jgi:hypothetical protein
MSKDSFLKWEYPTPVVFGVSFRGPHDTPAIPQNEQNPHQTQRAKWGQVVIHATHGAQIITSFAKPKPFAANAQSLPSRAPGA